MVGAGLNCRSMVGALAAEYYAVMHVPSSPQPSLLPIQPKSIASWTFEAREKSEKTSALKCACYDRTADERAAAGCEEINRLLRLCLSMFRL